MMYFMIGFWVVVILGFLFCVGYTFKKFQEEVKRNGY
jgi:hypothetical protein